VKKGVDSLISGMMGHRDGGRRLEVSFAGIEESDVELSVHRELTRAKFLCHQETCAGPVAVHKDETKAMNKNATIRSLWMEESSYFVHKGARRAWY